jgi:hypothetical protein
VIVFPKDKQKDVVDAIHGLLKSGGKTKVTVSEVQTIIAGRVRHYLAVFYPHLTPSELTMWTDKGSDAALLTCATEVVAKQEFERLITHCFDRLKVPDKQRAKVQEELLKNLKDQNGVERDKLAKLIEAELIKQKATPESFDVAAAMKMPPGVVICDFNWGAGDDRKLGTLLVNPRTGAIELFQVNQDGSGVTQIDSKKWIADTDWQVYSNPDEWGGIVGDPVWEKKRGEQREKLEECLLKDVGDINAMQNALEIADARFADSKFDQATKALESLEKLTKDALKLAANREQAIKELDDFTQAIVRAATPQSKVAAEQVMALVAAVKYVSKPEDIDVLVKRHSKLCELLKLGTATLGVAVDVETILKQTV